MRRDIYPKTLKQVRNSFDRFEEDFRKPKPEPVSEELMLKVFDQAMSIKINEEFEAKRKKRYSVLEEQLRTLGIR